MSTPKKTLGYWIVTFLAGISRTFTTSVLVFTAAGYAISFATKPASEVLAQTITAIGVTLGLAAVCLSSTITSPQTLRVLQYAGRHFLHASVLILQMLFLVFIKESVGTSGWFATTLRWAYQLAAILVIVPATWCCYYALADLNAELWTVWIESMPTREAPPEPARVQP